MRPALNYLLAIGMFIAAGYVGHIWFTNQSTTAHDVASRPQHAATTSNENTPSEPFRMAQEHPSNTSATLDQNVASREANSATAEPLKTRADAGGLDDQSKSTVVRSSAAQQAGSNQSKAAASSSDQAAYDTPVGGCMPIGITAGGALVFPLECRELLVRDRAGPPAPEPRSELTAEQVDHELQTVGSVSDQQIVNLPSTGSHARSEIDPMPQTRVKPGASRMTQKNGNAPEKVRQVSRPRDDRHSHERFAKLLRNPLALDCITCLLFNP